MSDSKVMLHRLLETMAQLGKAYDLDGNFLQAPQALMPSSHALNSRTDVQIGAASVLLELYRVVCQSAQGRKALRDLGFEPFFEPFFEQVERPEGSGVEMTTQLQQLEQMKRMAETMECIETLLLVEHDRRTKEIASCAALGPLQALPTKSVGQ